MNSSRLRETASNVRERARKVKELLREYSKTYKRIAVVSHFFTIKYLNATEFNEFDEPVNKVHMGNCGIFTATLEDLNKIN
jgi:broad specificity phosphatase PhoE